MILLRLVTWPYVRKHHVRSFLTIAGIVLGVTVFVGMHTANQSVLFAFYRTVDRIAGATQLQITAGEPGFPEEILEKVQAVPEVRVAVPVIEAVVTTPFGLRGFPRARPPTLIVAERDDFAGVLRSPLPRPVQNGSVLVDVTWDAIGRTLFGIYNELRPQ